MGTWRASFFLTDGCCRAIDGGGGVYFLTTMFFGASPLKSRYAYGPEVMRRLTTPAAMPAVIIVAATPARTRRRLRVAGASGISRTQRRLENGGASRSSSWRSSRNSARRSSSLG